MSATCSSPDTSKGHGKKRKHIAPLDGAVPESVLQVGHEAVKEKKRKRKSSGNEDRDADIVRQDQPSIEMPQVKRKKKGKKTDGQLQQEAEHEHFHAHTPLNGEEPQISTADFLSAIVAAATATSNSDLAVSHHHPGAGPSTALAPLVSHNPKQLSNGSALTADLFSGDTSSESILRAIQDIDASKLAQVLKALSDAQQAAATNPMDPLASFSNVLPPGMPINAALIAHLMHQEPPPLGQVPASAGSILGTKTPSVPAPQPHSVVDEYNSAEDAIMLSTKWLTASKLAELAKNRGLLYKKGKFSAIEEKQLKDAIERYTIAKQLNDDQLNEVIFGKEDKSRDNAFWSEITAAVPQRPIISVYHHVRRTHHPLKQQGKWLPSEDDKLRQGIASLGQQWEKISVLVGRRAADCRDRWRNHILDKDIRVTGVWSAEEEEELTRIVQAMTVERGGTLDDELFWGAISDQMGNKRNRQQCRIKWSDSLSKRVKLNGQQPRWSNQDAYILVHKLDSLRVRDDTEIDWKTLADKDWNLWSAHVLQRRWLTMKRSVKGYEEMSHQEIMEILKAKKTNFDPTPIREPKKRAKRITSAETVEAD